MVDFIGVDFMGAMPSLVCAGMLTLERSYFGEFALGVETRSGNIPEHSCSRKREHGTHGGEGFAFASGRRDTFMLTQARAWHLCK